jgi:uncharacterized membrane protein YkoI
VTLLSATATARRRAALGILVSAALAAGVGNVAFAREHGDERTAEHRYDKDKGDDRDRGDDRGKDKGRDAGNGMSLDQAVEMVQRRFNARVVRAETRREQGRTFYNLRLLSADGKVWTVRVDADSGALQ